ncbi:hypothetical protein [Ectobacillus ponti]|uniref:Uncharacterized protein n=1 Tax=Ectobacillus ponti TaxID=2961894 RepID=A0AA42BSH6_9BACI|nr:hypothetical protein [Ectobacillus ponti]MCP8970554.1 hypothetical protein [Ectobacillus ponti]
MKTWIVALEVTEVGEYRKSVYADSRSAALAEAFSSLFSDYGIVEGDEIKIIMVRKEI